MAETFDWIFFDCFNTLIDDFDEAGEEHGLCSLPAFAVDHGLFATREEFVAAYQGCRGEAYAQGREMVLTERLQRTIAVSPKVSPDAAEQARLVTAMTRIWAEEYDRLLRPTPDVAAMLAHWSARKPIGVVSNFFLPDAPERFLARFGLREHFRFVVDSARFGFRKPHTAIFDEALQQAGLTRSDAGRVLFIGDRIDLDVETPRALGMQVIHFHRGKTRLRVAPTPAGVRAIGSWAEFR
jgi:putative hydrolase of the HAD superfamily